MKKLGIDIGTSAVHMVLLEDKKIIGRWSDKHYGRRYAAVLRGLQGLGMIEDRDLTDAQDLKEAKLCQQSETANDEANINSSIDASQGSASIHASMEKISLCFTGADAGSFSDAGLDRCEDIPAIIEGASFLAPGCGSIIEIGSQNAIFITDLSEKAPRFATNEHCAGGTGSFFEDQMQRLGLKIEDYSSLVEKATGIPNISGRCSVFAKTDIIHRQQEGICKENILKGLCYAMIRNYKAAIVRSLPIKKPLALLGGVSLNAGVRMAVQDVFHVSEDEVIVPEDAVYAGAVGAAIMAKQSMNPEKLKDSLLRGERAEKDTINASALPKLALREGTILTDPTPTKTIPAEGAFLGIDVGSTSTDLVLTGPDGSLIDYLYLRTSGDPEKAVRGGMAEFASRYPDVKILGVGITGSGRERLGRMMGADVIRDEITAQAKAATSFFPEADTVFEIGGQDSKYISIKDGKVVDFQMNKICAAGTGSFIEEQASRMNIALADFGRMALQADQPCELGERCTVFIGTAIAQKEAEGAAREEIAAGLCHAIVRNYLHKVVGNRRVGQHIVLQGGVDYNPGIVAAFQSAYGDRVSVSPVFSVSGAYGAALLAEEAMTGREVDTAVISGQSSFAAKFAFAKGADSAFVQESSNVKESTFLGFNFPSIDRDANAISEEIKRNLNFYRKTGLLIYEDYDGTIDPRKKTIGVPLVLVIVKFFPMINAFFRNLGFNVILSKPTNQETIALAQQYASGENCYPVKLIYGHMMQLAEKKVDYIFLPSIHTIKHPHASAKHSYGCPYMQIAARMVYDSLHLKDKGIQLLSPVLDLELGAQYMAMAMLQTGIGLGFSKPRCMIGLTKGAAAVKKMSENTEKLGKELINSLPPEEKVLVLVSRAYGIADPVLNMGIPEILMKKGYKVITSEHLPGLSLDLKGEYPHMYWPFGDHLLSSAKIIAHHPNLYMVYLTNHGCGPDSLLGHIMREEMGDKPYLQIEVDEHYSPVGVRTRIEAFLNSIENQPVKEKAKGFDMMDVDYKKPNIIDKPVPGRKLLFPDLGAYSPLLKEYFETLGYKTDILRFDDKTMIRGRAEMNAKEYLPMTAITGAALVAAEKDRNVQFLIPFDYGSDAEGQYARAVRSILDRNGYADVPIVGPMLEELPDSAINFDLLVRAMLTGDLTYCLEKSQRDQIDHILSQEELLTLAEQIRANAETSSKTMSDSYINSSVRFSASNNNEGKALSNKEGRTIEEDITIGDDRRIAIVGSPMSLTSLDDDVLGRQEEEGYNLMRMPLTEMLLSLWKDHERNPQVPLVGKISERLGKASIFAENLDTLSELADQKLYSFNANQGRYRLAKTVQLSEKCSAVINIAPRYENTAMILQMERNEMKIQAPVYDLFTDDDFDENAWARLRSFLYYALR